MKMKASDKSGGEDFELAPAGTHPAVCVAVIDLGTQEEEFQGNVNKKRKILIAWELVTEKMSTQPRNHVIARDYALSGGKKSNLRALIEKWRGKALRDDEEFDVMKLIGQPCLLSVVHGTSKSSGNDFHRVDGAIGPPKGVVVPAAQLKPFSFEITWKNGDAKTLPDVPEWVPFSFAAHKLQGVKEIIQLSEEWTGKKDSVSSDSGRKATEYAKPTEQAGNGHVIDPAADEARF